MKDYPISMIKEDSEEIKHCQYTQGECDQKLFLNKIYRGFFIYPSEPSIIANTILTAVESLKEHSSKTLWMSWQNLIVGGRLIFCEICKTMRAADLVIADITTLNFNVLFELGHALGLNKPVLPIRDTTYQRDKKLFDELGIFDVLGYEDFQSSNDLVGLVNKYASICTV